MLALKKDVNEKDVNDYNKYYNNKYCVVITTIDRESNAENIARHLVENKLAGCVHIDKIKSYYRWQDGLQVDSEYRLLIKAPIKKYKAIEKAILELHSYSVPQIVKLDITDGLNSYLQWLDGTCMS